jgi:type I restriction enzyme, S subunit
MSNPFFEKAMSWWCRPATSAKSVPSLLAMLDLSHALIIVQLRPGLGSGSYLSLLLQSRYGQNALRWSQTGALHPHLECGHLREIPIVLPPALEQDAIVEAIQERTAEVDRLTEMVTAAVERLKELRTALISAAVTGKIDVRAA